jgi:hypothetical protein
LQRVLFVGGVQQGPVAARLFHRLDRRLDVTRLLVQGDEQAVFFVAEPVALHSVPDQDTGEQFHGLS